MKKLISNLIIFTIVISSLLFVGCSGKGSPTDSALAYFDLYAKQEKTDKLPISSEEADKILANQKNLFVSNFEAAGASKESAEKVYKKTGELAKKVTVKAEEVSNKDNTAVIKLTSKPIDGSSQQKLMESKKTDLSNANSLTEFLIEYYDTLIKDTKFKDKETSVNITLKKNNDIWTIDEKTEVDKLSSLVLSK